MEVVEGSNTDILNYFTKFEKNNNYEKYLDDLKRLSIFRLRGEISLGEYMIPDVGPSEEISTFPDKIEGWDERDIFELKNIIKLFDSGEIESLEEAVILIEILKRNEKSPPVLDNIFTDLQKGSFENSGNYDQLLSFDNGESDSIIYGNLWKFLISMSC